MTYRFLTLLCSTAVAVASATPEQPASATPTIPAPPAAQSYADLLEPVPDALNLLKVDEARRAKEQARVVPAQFYHHHHHHHHHGFFHHHHHHHGFFSFGFSYPYGDYYAPRYYYPERCYWTRGAPFWNGYRWVYPRIRECY